MNQTKNHTTGEQEQISDEKSAPHKGPRKNDAAPLLLVKNYNKKRTKRVETV